MFLYHKSMAQLEVVVDDSVQHTILTPLQTGRAMSFFPNSSGVITINGGEFVNNEGTNKIEEGKHIFVHS